MWSEASALADLLSGRAARPRRASSGLSSPACVAAAALNRPAPRCWSSGTTLMRRRPFASYRNGRWLRTPRGIHPQVSHCARPPAGVGGLGSVPRGSQLADAREAGAPPMRGAQLGELISRSLDERMLYCQCCPHRPIPAYPDVHYPFAVCDCCPRLIPKAAWRPISRRPSICSSCKRRVFEERMTGGFVGLIAG